MKFRRSVSRFLFQGISLRPLHECHQRDSDEYRMSPGSGSWRGASAPPVAGPTFLWQRRTASGYGTGGWWVYYSLVLVFYFLITHSVSRRRVMYYFLVTVHLQHTVVTLVVTLVHWNVHNEFNQFPHILFAYQGLFISRCREFVCLLSVLRSFVVGQIRPFCRTVSARRV